MNPLTCSLHSNVRMNTHFSRMLKNIMNKHKKEIEKGEYNYKSLRDELVKTLQFACDGDKLKDSAWLIRYMYTLPSFLNILKIKYPNSIYSDFYKKNENEIKSRVESGQARITSYRQFLMNFYDEYVNKEGMIDSGIAVALRDHLVNQELGKYIFDMTTRSVKHSERMIEQFSKLGVDNVVSFSYKDENNKTVISVGRVEKIDVNNNKVTIIQNGVEKVISINQINKFFKHTETPLVGEYIRLKKEIKRLEELNSSIDPEAPNLINVAEQYIGHLKGKIANNEFTIGPQKKKLPAEFKKYPLLRKFAWGKNENHLSSEEAQLNDILQEAHFDTKYNEDFYREIETLLTQRDNVSSESELRSVALSEEKVQGDLLKLQDLYKKMASYEKNALFQTIYKSFEIFKDTQQKKDTIKNNGKKIEELRESDFRTDEEIADEFDSLNLYQSYFNDMIGGENLTRAYSAMHNSGDFITQMADCELPISSNLSNKEISRIQAENARIVIRKFLSNAQRNILTAKASGREFDIRLYNTSFNNEKILPLEVINAADKYYGREKKYIGGKEEDALIPIAVIAIYDGNNNFVKCDDEGNLIYKGESGYDNANYIVLNIQTLGMFIGKNGNKAFQKGFEESGLTKEKYAEKLLQRDAVSYTEAYGNPDGVKCKLTGGSDGSLIKEVRWENQANLSEIEYNIDTDIVPYVETAPWSLSPKEDNETRQMYRRTGFNFRVKDNLFPVTFCPIEELTTDDNYSVASAIARAIDNPSLIKVPNKENATDIEKLDYLAANLQSFMFIKHNGKFDDTNKIYQIDPESQKEFYQPYMSMDYDKDKGLYVIGIRYETNTPYVNYYYNPTTRTWIKEGDGSSAKKENMSEVINEFFGRKRGSSKGTSGNNSDYNYAKVNSVFKSYREDNDVDLPYYFNGEIQFKKEKYRTLIKRTSRVVLSSDNVSDGKVKTVNPFLTFEKVDSRTYTISEDKIKAFIESVNSNKLTPKESYIIVSQIKRENENVTEEFKNLKINEESNLNDNDEDLPFSRYINEIVPFSIGHDDIVSDEDIKRAKEWYEKNKIGELFPFKEMFNIVNSKGVANWTKHGVNLFSGSDYTELYHEAWHGFTQGLLSKEEKSKLYDSLRNNDETFVDHSKKTVAFKDATDEQIEEFLADKFRLFAKNKGAFTEKQEQQTKGVLGKAFRNVLNLFKKIWKLLSKLFGKRTAKQLEQDKIYPFDNPIVKELYDNLYYNKLDKYVFKEKNRQFGVLYSGIRNVSEETRSEITYPEELKATIEEIEKDSITEVGENIKAQFSPVESEGAIRLMDHLCINFLDNYNKVKNSEEKKKALDIYTTITNLFDNNVNNALKRFNTAIIRLKETGKISLKETEKSKNKEEIKNVVKEFSDKNIHGKKKLSAYISEEDLTILAESYLTSSKSEVLNLLMQNNSELKEKMYNFCLDGLCSIYNVLKKTENKTIKQKRRMMLVKKMIYNYGNFNIKGEGVAVGHLLSTPIFDKPNSLSEFENEKTATGENYSASDDELSLIDMMKSDIKFLLSTLHSDNNDESNCDTFGTQLFEPIGTVVGVLSSELSNLNTSNDKDKKNSNEEVNTNRFVAMYKKMREIALTYPPVKELIIRLGNPIPENYNIDIATLNLWTRFYQTFDKPRVHAEFVQYKENVKEDNKEKSTFSIVEGESFGDYSNIINKWSNRFNIMDSTKNPFIMNEPNKGMRYLTVDKTASEELPFFITDNGVSISYKHTGYLNANSTIYQKNKDKLKIGFNPLDGDNIKYPKKGIERIIDYLNKIGISLTKSDALIDDMRRNFSEPIYEGVSYEQAIVNIVNAIYNSNVVSFKQLLSNCSTDIKVLAMLEAKYTRFGNQFKYTRADGNIGYENIMQNEYTIVVSALNKCKSYWDVVKEGKDNFLSYFDIIPWEYGTDGNPIYDENGKLKINPNYNPAVAASGVMQRMFDIDFSSPGKGLKNFRRKTFKTGGQGTNDQFVELNLSTISGSVINSEDGTKGESRYGEDAETHLIESIILASKGVSEIVRPADKPTCFSFSVNDGTKNKISFQEIRDFINDYRPIGGQPKGNMEDSNLVKKITGNLLQYVIGEAERILIIKNDIANGNPIDETLIKKGSDFYNLKGLISDETIKIIKKETGIENINTKNIIENQNLIAIPKESMKVKILNNDNIKKAIAKDVVKYFFKTEDGNLSLIDATKERLLDESIKFLSIKINPKFDKKYSGDFRFASPIELIYNYAINGYLNNLSSWNFLFGDLAQYGDVKNANKRNAGGNGTGETFRTDDWMCDFINNKYKSTSYLSTLQNRIKKGSFDKSIQLASRILGNSENPKTINPFVYGNVLQTAVVNEIVEKSELVDIYKKLVKDSSSISEYENMKTCDGQGFISFDAYRALKIAQGSWSEKQEELFEKVCKGENITQSEAKEFFPVYKTQYFGPSARYGVKQMEFHKYSLCPIIPSVVEGTTLEAIHYRMMKEGIAYIVFESGSKTGKIYEGRDEDGNGGHISQIFKNNNIDEDFLDSDSNVFIKDPIYTDFLKDQVVVHSEDKGRILFPTQLRRVIEIEFFDKGAPIDYKGKEDWKSLTEEEKLEKSECYKKIRKYEIAVTTYVEEERERLFKEFGIEQLDEEGEKFRITKLDKLLPIIERELAKNGVIEDNLQYIRDKFSEKGDHDISYSANSDEIEDMIISLINRRIIKQPIKGDAFVQVASSLFGELKLRQKNEGKDFTNPDEEQITKYKSDDLPFYNPKLNEKGEIIGSTSAMKVKIALRGDFRKLLYEKHFDGEKIAVFDDNGKLIEKDSLKRLNECLKNDEWLDKDNGRLRKTISIVGVRIPTQGPNSIESMEVYEFLPQEAGSIIIPPKEIVAKAGSDFDIDKMYIMLPSLASDNGSVYCPTRYNEKSEIISKDIIESEIENANKNIEDAENDIKKAGFEDINALENRIKELLDTNKENFESAKRESFVIRNNAFEELKKGLEAKSDKYRFSWEKAYDLIELYKEDGDEILPKGKVFPKGKELDEYFKLLGRQKEISKEINTIKSQKESVKYDIEELNSRIKSATKKEKTALISERKEKINQIKEYSKKQSELIKEISEINKQLLSEENLKIYKSLNGIFLSQLYNDNLIAGGIKNVNEKFDDIKEVKEERDKLIELSIAYHSAVNEKKYYEIQLLPSALSNDLIQDIKDIVLDKNFFTALITPNTTKKFTKDKDKEEKMTFVQRYMALNTGVRTKDMIDESPSCVFNPLHDESKYLSNYIGKKNLGILAVENVSFSSLLRHGITMNMSKTFPIGEIIGGHYNGNKMLFDSKYDKDGDSIQDCISQLINGAVDVAKDDWLFFVGVSNEMVSIFTFMIMNGVPAKNALKVINNPAVKDYIADEIKTRGLLGGIIYNKNEKTLEELLRKERQEKKLKNARKDIVQGKKVVWTIEDYKDSSDDDKMIAVYKELKNYVNALTQLKLSIKVDTETDLSYTSLQDKKIGQLNNNLRKKEFKYIDEDSEGEFDYFDEEQIKELYIESILAPFNQRDLKLGLIKDLMKEKTEVIDKVLSFPFRAIKETAYSPKPDIESQKGSSYDKKLDNYFKKYYSYLRGMYVMDEFFMSSSEDATKFNTSMTSSIAEKKEAGTELSTEEKVFGIIRSVVDDSKRIKTFTDTLENGYQIQKTKEYNSIKEGIKEVRVPSYIKSYSIYGKETAEEMASILRKNSYDVRMEQAERGFEMKDSVLYKSLYLKAFGELNTVSESLEPGERARFANIVAARLYFVAIGSYRSGLPMLSNRTELSLPYYFDLIKREYSKEEYTELMNTPAFKMLFASSRNGEHIFEKAAMDVYTDEDLKTSIDELCDFERCKEYLIIYSIDEDGNRKVNMNDKQKETLDVRARELQDLMKNIRTHLYFQNAVGVPGSFNFTKLTSDSWIEKQIKGCKSRNLFRGKEESLYYKLIDKVNKKDTNCLILSRDVSETTDKLTEGNMNGEHYIVSGGAVGADYISGIAAKKAGLDVYHLYTGINTEENAPYGNMFLSYKDTIEAAKGIQEAAQLITETPNRLTDPRIVRDYSQAKYSDVIVAFAPIIKAGDEIRKNTPSNIDCVLGGTRFAVATAMLQDKEIYVFNDKSKNNYAPGWYKFVYDVEKGKDRLNVIKDGGSIGHWEKIKGNSNEDIIPNVKNFENKRIAAIGSTNLSERQKSAIAKFFNVDESELTENRKESKEVNKKEGTSLKDSQSIPFDFKGQMNASYDGLNRDGVTEKTTFDAILNGERTATTRYASSDKQKEYLEYWKKAKVGDIIQWRSEDGRTLLVKLTKEIHKLEPANSEEEWEEMAEEWSKKEGWSKEKFFNKVKQQILGDGAWQMEFELYDPSNKTPVLQNVSNNDDEIKFEYNGHTYKVNSKYQIFNEKGKEVFKKDAPNVGEDRTKIITNYEYIRGNVVSVKFPINRNEENIVYVIRQKNDDLSDCLLVNKSTGNILNYSNEQSERKNMIKQALKEFKEKDNQNNNSNNASSLSKQIPLPLNTEKSSVDEQINNCNGIQFKLNL